MAAFCFGANTTRVSCNKPPPLAIRPSACVFVTVQSSGCLVVNRQLDLDVGCREHQFASIISVNFCADAELDMDGFEVMVDLLEGIQMSHVSPVPPELDVDLTRHLLTLEGRFDAAKNTGLLRWADDDKLSQMSALSQAVQASRQMRRDRTVQTSSSQIKVYYELIRAKLLAAFHWHHIPEDIEWPRMPEFTAHVNCPNPLPSRLHVDPQQMTAFLEHQDVTVHEGQAMQRAAAMPNARVTVETIADAASLLPTLRVQCFRLGDLAAVMPSLPDFAVAGIFEIINSMAEDDQRWEQDWQASLASDARPCRIIDSKRLAYNREIEPSALLGIVHIRRLPRLHEHSSLRSKDPTGSAQHATASGTAAAPQSRMPVPANRGASTSAAAGKVTNKPAAEPDKTLQRALAQPKSNSPAARERSAALLARELKEERNRQAWARVGKEPPTPKAALKTPSATSHRLKHEQALLSGSDSAARQLMPTYTSSSAGPSAPEAPAGSQSRSASSAQCPTSTSQTATAAQAAGSHAHSNPRLADTANAGAATASPALGNPQHADLLEHDQGQPFDGPTAEADHSYDGQSDLVLGLEHGSQSKTRASVAAHATAPAKPPKQDRLIAKAAQQGPDLIQNARQQEAYASAVAQQLLKEEEEAARAAEARKEAKQRKQAQRRAREQAKLQQTSPSVSPEAAPTSLQQSPHESQAVAASVLGLEPQEVAMHADGSELVQQVSEAVASSALSQPSCSDGSGTSDALPAASQHPDQQSQQTPQISAPSSTSDPAGPASSLATSTQPTDLGVKT